MAPQGASSCVDEGSTRPSRYDPLRLYLAERQEPVVHLSFVEIERVIGAPFPGPARRYRPWWANERSGNHVHASAWLGVGRSTANVNLNAETVDFVRRPGALATAATGSRKLSATTARGLRPAARSGAVASVLRNKTDASDLEVRQMGLGYWAASSCARSLRTPRPYRRE